MRFELTPEQTQQSITTQLSSKVLDYQAIITEESLPF